MSTQERLISAKVRLLQLAQELGNISKTRGPIPDTAVKAAHLDRPWMTS